MSEAEAHALADEANRLKREGREKKAAEPAAKTIDLTLVWGSLRADG